MMREYFAGGRRRIVLRRLVAGLFAVAVVVVVVVIVHGSRLAPRVLGVLQVQEHWFLRDWASEYADGEAPNPATSDYERLFGKALASAAASRASEPTTYDPAYVEIPYPSGDISPDRGVCTDLVVRAYRDVDVDLQRDVHVDMSSSFGRYPAIWGTQEPDSNIDHRRVPNLMVFFSRHGQMLPITSDPRDYEPGDIVTWHLGGGHTHIGIVTDQRDPETEHPHIAHHIGGRPTVEDVLFAWEVIGHFRYQGRADQ